MPAFRLRRRLPTRRTLTGAALVTVAACGVLVAHRSASTPPTTRYVVATAALPAGHVIDAGDLGTVAMHLPSKVPAIAEHDADELIGRITRTPVGELALMRPSDLHDRERLVDPASVEVALELQPARALHGVLGPGDAVHVLSTDANGQGTAVVARSVLVTGIGGGDDRDIGSSSTVRVRLGTSDLEQAASILDASVRSEVSLALPAPTGGGAP